MDQLYYFFDLDYEDIYRPADIPYRLLIVSVGYVGFHWHSEAEILLVLDGEVRIRNNHGLANYSAGDIVIIRPNELHSLVEVSSNLVLVVQVEESFFNLDSSASGPRSYPLPPFAPVSPGVMDDLRADLSRMAREVWDRSDGYEALALSALYHFMGSLRRSVAAEADDVDAEATAHTDRSRIKKVLHFLHGNYTRPVSLQDVADEIGVSRSHASHLVKKGTGRSMQENLGYIRTGRAINLMMTTDRTLLDISLSVGFSDLKYFNKYFHKLFGCTPREMRKNPDWKQAVLNHYRNEGVDPAYGRPFIDRYLETRESGGSRGCN